MFWHKFYHVPLEMRNTALFILFIFLCLDALAASKRIPTPETVNAFINNLETLYQLSDQQRDYAYDLREHNIRCFAATEDGKGGINIDFRSRFNSEFYYLGLEPVSDALRYCNKLYKTVYKEKSLKLCHEILYTEEIKAPDIDGKDELYFYVTKIKKTCTYNNITAVVWQSFEVGASNGLIDKIEGYATRPSSWQLGKSESHTPPSNKPLPQATPKPQEKRREEKVAPRTQEEELSEKDLLRLAARYYTAKDYTAASSVLQKINKKYPQNAEAWFRLALIVRYKTKWSKKVFTDPKKSAIDFMRKASELASGKLKSKADNALYYWEHPNYM